MKNFWHDVGTEKNYKFKELVKCLADLSCQHLWLVSHEVDLLEEIDFLHAMFISFLPQNVVLTLSSGSFSWSSRKTIIVIITIMGALIEGYVLRTQNFQMYTKTRKILDLITAL